MEVLIVYFLFHLDAPFISSFPLLSSPLLFSSFSFPRNPYYPCPILFHTTLISPQFPSLYLPFFLFSPNHLLITCNLCARALFWICIKLSASLEIIISFSFFSIFSRSDNTEASANTARSCKINNMCN
jgi:hypothetical protein